MYTQVFLWKSYKHQHACNTGIPCEEYTQRHNESTKTHRHVENVRGDTHHHLSPPSSCNTASRFPRMRCRASKR